jgi:hypothetical protein
MSQTRIELAEANVDALERELTELVRASHADAREQVAIVVVIQKLQRSHRSLAAALERTEAARSSLNARHA